MTPQSGAISLAQIRTELGASGPISLGDTAVRTALFKASGAVSLSDGYAVYLDTISAAANNVNMRSRAVSAGWNQSTPLKHTLTINSGVVVGSTSTANPSLDTGTTFPSGTGLRINNNGYIVGAGGQGGDSLIGVNGKPGGTALTLRFATQINNLNIIGGGGGGGGGGFGYRYSGAGPVAPGGGGAGSIFGAKNNAYFNDPRLNSASPVYGGDPTLTNGGNGTSNTAFGDPLQLGGAGGSAGLSGSMGVSSGSDCYYRAWTISCNYATGACSDQGYYDIYYCTDGSNTSCAAFGDYNGCSSTQTIRSPAGGGGLGASGGSGAMFGFSPAAGAGGTATSGAGSFATWIATGTRYGTIG